MSNQKKKAEKQFNKCDDHRTPSCSCIRIFNRFSPLYLIIFNKRIILNKVIKIQLDNKQERLKTSIVRDYLCLSASLVIDAWCGYLVIVKQQPK